MDASGRSSSAAAMASSSPPLASSANSSSMDASVLTSSVTSSPSYRLSPTRGLKRMRDVDGNDPRQRLAPSDSTTTGEPRAKRPFEIPSPGSNSSNGASPSMAVGDSLRISNELLRSENDQLQQEIARLQGEKTSTETELTQQKQRIRNLEEDLTRIYRRQKRDAETRQVAHAKTVESLREELERLAKQLEDQPTIDPSMAMLTPNTTKEMDAFVSMCAQWQAKLTTLSTELANRVAKIEEIEVSTTMEDMLNKVGQAHQVSELQNAEKELEMQRAVLRQREHDLQLVMDKIKVEREESESFEAMERRVLEERVLDLERSAQNAQENERVLLQQMAGLRDELVKVRSGNHVIPQSEWQQKLLEEAQMKEQLDALTVRCEAQNVQLTLLREDLASLQTENDELASDLTARKKAASEDGDTSSIVLQQLEDRVAELKEQLAEAKTKAREAEVGLRSEHAVNLQEETENLNNRIEVLTMNVDAKAKVIDGLTSEKTDLIAKLAKKKEAMKIMHADTITLQEQVTAKNLHIEELRNELAETRMNVESRLLQAVKEANAEKQELQKQMTSKTCDWVELNREVKELRKQVESKAAELRQISQEKNVIESRNEELRRLEEQWLLHQPELANLEKQNKELLGQHEHQSTREARIQDQVTAIERENKYLRVQLEDMRLLAAAAAEEESKPVVPLQQDGGESLSPELQARIAKLLVEKRAVENFLRCYFDTAEAKCQTLARQVVQLEAKQETQRKYARDSCHLLRMCTQIDSCDSTVRASILDVMSTLKSIA